MSEKMDTIKKVLANILKVDYSVIDTYDKSKSLEDLGFDSIATINLVVNIEGSYGISIEDEDLLSDKWDTLKKIEQLMEKYLDN